jgi:transposase InsO family protein
MTERHKFVLAYQAGLFSMTELCARFSISRKTGYKWLHRYQKGGLEALRDRSRAPHTCPHRTEAATEALLIQTRQAHPRWGPRKLLDYLRRRYPAICFPAASTVGDLLQRAGLVQARPRRRRWPHPGARAIQAEAPGQLWTADFKGEFRLGSGPYCYPLTVQDAYSRYVLACQGLTSTAHPGAQAVFRRLFRAQGLPRALRTDNGAPFATRAMCGLSRLSVWWIKLGIEIQRIEPGAPQQNGRHERMHRTLKAEATRPPAASMRAQQRRFEAFLEEFNTVRPHQALDGAVPASCYAPSPRRLPARVPGPSYGGHLEVRKVSRAGQISFQGQFVFLSEVLHGERVGLEEVDEGLWSVWFYDRLLARLDAREFTVHPGMP